MHETIADERNTSEVAIIHDVRELHVHAGRVAKPSVYIIAYPPMNRISSGIHSPIFIPVGTSFGCVLFDQEYEAGPIAVSSGLFSSRVELIERICQHCDKSIIHGDIELAEDFTTKYLLNLKPIGKSKSVEPIIVRTLPDLSKIAIRVDRPSLKILDFPPPIKPDGIDIHGVEYRLNERTFGYSLSNRNKLPSRVAIGVRLTNNLTFLKSYLDQYFDQVENLNPEKAEDIFTDDELKKFEPDFKPASWQRAL